MSLQEKLDNIKYQLTSLTTISEEIRKDSYTVEGMKKIMTILDRHKILDNFGRFYKAMYEIYKEHDQEFNLPRFQDDCYGTDWAYTQEHDYLLLKITTSKHCGISFIGFDHVFFLHKKNTETHTPETTYKFVMDCVWYIQSVARKMLTLPIFNANQLIFLSLMQHYYVNCDIEVCPRLKYIIDRSVFDYLGDDFKRMVFETNGSDPLSVRASLPVISYYARKKALDPYSWAGSSDPSLLVKDMRSNKALNLRKAFDKMESYLGNASATVNKRIDFDCVVGVETECYTPGLNRIYGISDKPVAFFSNRLRFGIFGSCLDPRKTSFGETYVGWIEFDGEEIIYDRFEDLFSCFEDDVVNTLEDNYNFLLEKLPDLDKGRLRNGMLEYIMEGF